MHLASSNVKKGSHCKYLYFRNWDNFVSVCCSKRAMWQWGCRATLTKWFFLQNFQVFYCYFWVLFSDCFFWHLLLLEAARVVQSALVLVWEYLKLMKTVEQSLHPHLCVCVCGGGVGGGVLQPLAGERSALFLSDRLDRKTRAGARGRNGRGEGVWWGR